MKLPDAEPSPSLAGSLLFASPALRGGPFERAVILLSQHSAEDGAFGLILNQPSGQVVGDVLQDASFHPLRHLSVHHAGPVADDQLFFAALWWDGKKGLRLAQQISAEEAIIQQKKSGTLVRAFIGYSGWSPGQLEDEIEQNTWIATPTPSQLLGLSHDRSLWFEALRALSPFHRLLAEAPQNPAAN
ncbi:MAG: hypothetical protein RL117_505 [Verrucomicrobiota bacterium]|jgi:putative transcriptional regulator